MPIFAQTNTNVTTEAGLITALGSASSGETVTITAPLNLTQAVTVNNGVELVINSGVMFFNILADGSITNNGTIINNGWFSLYGTMINNGILTLNFWMGNYSTGVINNNGTFDNNGDFDSLSGSTFTGNAPVGTGTFSAQPPSAPTLNNATPNDTGGIVLAWTAPTNIGGTAIIRYEYSTDGTNWKTIPGGGTPQTSPQTITETSAAGNNAFVNSTQYSITIRAVNSAGNSVASSGINATPLVAPSITSAAKKSVSNCKERTFQVQASGTQPITFSISGQPAGVSIDADGLITIAKTVSPGTPHTFTITATNGIDPDATQDFTLTVRECATSFKGNIIVRGGGSLIIGKP